MEFICHRINTVSDLKNIPTAFGCEIDLRDKGDRIILTHDPFTDGEDFEEFLDNYNHKTLICNVKSERIEWRIIELLKQYKVEKYFFLDSSFPMIFALSEAGEKNIAVRFSELEGLDTVLAVKDRISWVWVDCFTKLPINKDIYNTFKKNNFKLCLVSPELQKRDSDIEKYKIYLKENNIQLDAICTKFKNIPLWK